MMQMSILSFPMYLFHFTVDIAICPAENRLSERMLLPMPAPDGGFSQAAGTALGDWQGSHADENSADGNH